MPNQPSTLHVPLLPLDDARLEVETLATWHLALCGSVGPDLPHDLLAIWLYTADGPVLLGPAALAADGLTPPRPVPHVPSAESEAFAAIFERARYADTLVQPVAYGRTDVALLVCASFAAPADRPAKEALLLELAQRLAPMLARAARQWCEADVGRVAEPVDQAESLLSRLAAAPSADASPAGLCVALFDALAPVIPHDAAGVFVPGASHDTWYALHRQRDGVLWQSADCQVAEVLLERVLPTEHAGVMEPRSATDTDWQALFPGLEGRPASACCVRLIVGGRRVGLLVVASMDREVYGARERRALAISAPYIAARIDGLLAAQDAAVARARASALQVVPVQLGRLAALLGTRPDSAAAWRELVAESTTLLPLRRLRLAVRLGAHDRVAFVTPGETRPFADLPSTPITGTPLAELLSGERPWVRIPDNELLDHAFPLRVGGELIGAMLVATAPDEPLGRAHMALAQHLADLLAPHLELQRRPYVRPSFLPGWKRV
jgi:hypothetical protein